MGAETFVSEALGETPQQAFDNAKRLATAHYGNRGYTGSIAEKCHFTMATTEIMDKLSAYSLADKLTSTTYRDKWGAAGCIQLTSSSIRNPNSQNQNPYLFFGWASA